MPKGRGASESRRKEPDSRREQAGRTPVMGRTNRGEQLTPRAVVAHCSPSWPCVQWELGRLWEAGVSTHAHTSTAVTPHPPALSDSTWPQFSATLVLIVYTPVMATAECGMLFKGHTA